MDPYKFSKLIKDYREREKLSQCDLAMRLGVTQRRKFQAPFGAFSSPVIS